MPRVISVVAAVAAVVLAAALPAAASPAAPGPPRALTAAADAADGSVALSWTRPGSGTVAGYLVYVFGAGSADRVPLGSTFSRSFATSCALWQGCAFEVTAYDAAGDESAPSNRVFVGGAVPSAPQAVVATPDPVTGTVTLTWAPPAQGPATSYSVYQWSEADGSRTPIGSTTGLSLVASCPLAAGCGFEVTASNVAGESLPSGRVVVGGEVPSPPRSLRAVANPRTGDVNLSWAAPTVGPVFSYLVEFWSADDPTRVLLGSTGARTFATSCALQVGCSFAVTAANAAGQSIASARVTVGGEAPSPPRSLVAVRDVDDTVTLTWTRPAVNPAGSYTVYAFGDGSTARTVLGGSSTTTFETSCPDGCAYAVTASNAAGESAESNRAVVGTVSGSPADPGTPSVQTSGAGTITLSPFGLFTRWERQVGTKPWSVTSTSTSCPDPAAGCHYRLIGVGATSNLVKPAVTVDLHPPEAPRTVRVAATGMADLTVSWAPPRNDGGFDVASYAVERRSASMQWTEVTSVGAGTRSTAIPCPNGGNGAACPVRVVAETAAGRSAPVAAACTAVPPAGADLAASCTWDHAVGDAGLASTGVGVLPYGAVGVLERAIEDGTAGTLDPVGDCDDALSALEVTPTWSACWPAAERDDPLWYPQGVATNHDAGGWWPGRDIVLVSSYERLAPDDTSGSNGIRLSVIDAGSRRFVHLPMLAPGLGELFIHAGGIAQAGHYLYVVDTDDGFWVFDLDVVSTAVVDGVLQPALVAVGHHQRTAGTLRFSSVDVDRTFAGAGIGSLLVTEYLDGATGARIVRFPLGPDGLIGGAATAVDELVTVDRPSGRDITNLQGGSACGPHLYLDRSAGTAPGTLFRSAARQPSTDIPWLRGPEDLACDAGDHLWSIGEHPGRRAILQVDVPDLEAAGPSS